VTQAIGARRDGDAFQARLFWLKAAYLLDDTSPVIRVGFESGPKGFDDVWVEYAATGAPRDPHGIPLTREHLQCKWHVAPGTYTHQDLIDPAFINATARSLLQRAHQALTAHQTPAGRMRFSLVTNWHCDPSDALAKLIRTRSHTIRVEQLFEGATARSATGRIRKLWREHLGIDDAELHRLASALGLSMFSESLEQMRERLDVTCKAYGLRRIPAASSTVIYDDIIRQWATEGRNEFDRQQFRDAVAQESLLEPSDRRLISFGFKSFEHAIDHLEDRCEKVLDLVPEFDERFIRDTAAWRTELLPRLREFLIHAAQSGGDRLRLAMDAHTTLAFVAGTVLDTKSGRIVEVEQRSPSRLVWAPDDSSSKPDWPQWDIRRHELTGATSDLAVAVGLTHDVEPKVRAYLEAHNSPCQSILVCTPTGGSSSDAVKSGSHAFQLAAKLASNVKAQRESMPEGSGGRLHLFMAAPNGFSFYLGRHVSSLGPLTLYEFDFGHQRGGSYEPSLALPEVTEPQ
jgi:SMODS-associated and fused to various effectors sensor domain